MKFKSSKILFVCLAVFSLFVGLACVCAADATDTYDHNFTFGGLDTPMPHALDDGNRPDVPIVNEKIKELIESIINGEYPPCPDDTAYDSTDMNSTFIDNTAAEDGGAIVGTLVEGQH